MTLFWHTKPGLRITLKDYVCGNRAKLVGSVMVDLMRAVRMEIGMFIRVYLASH